jgi:hypothetical protein
MRGNILSCFTYAHPNFVQTARSLTGSSMALQDIHAHGHKPASLVHIIHCNYKHHQPRLTHHVQALTCMILWHLSYDEKPYYTPPKIYVAPAQTSLVAQCRIRRGAPIPTDATHVTVYFDQVIVAGKGFGEDAIDRITDAKTGKLLFQNRVAPLFDKVIDNWAYVKKAFMQAMEEDWVAEEKNRLLACDVASDNPARERQTSARMTLKGARGVSWRDATGSEQEGEDAQEEDGEEEEEHSGDAYQASRDSAEQKGVGGNDSLVFVESQSAADCKASDRLDANGSQGLHQAPGDETAQGAVENMGDLQAQIDRDVEQQEISPVEGQKTRTAAEQNEEVEQHMSVSKEEQNEEEAQESAEEPDSDAENDAGKQPEASGSASVGDCGGDVPLQEVKPLQTISSSKLLSTAVSRERVRTMLRECGDAMTFSER